MEKIYKSTRHTTYTLQYKTETVRKSISISNYIYYHTKDQAEQDFLENTVYFKQGLIKCDSVAEEEVIAKEEPAQAEFESVASKTTTKKAKTKTAKKADNAENNYSNITDLQEAAEILFNDYNVTATLETKEDIEAAAKEVGIEFTNL